MNDKLLYFPYINIPNNNWTVKSLLYWDRIGVIVPNETDNFLQKFTSDLIDAEFVDLIVPYQHMYKIPNFDAQFTKLIKNPSLNLEQKRNDFLIGYMTKIHVQKLGIEVMEYLVEQKIAVKDRKNWDWYYVESKTASLIMLFLASVIGKVEDYTPSTDDLINLNLSVTQNTLEVKLNDLRNETIDDLFPYPIDPDLKKFRDFKEKYNEQLKTFRLFMEQYIFQLHQIKNIEERKHFSNLKHKEIDFYRAEILSKLNESKLGKILFGSACGVLASFVGGFNPYAFINAVHATVQNSSESIPNQEYAYLALVDKYFKK
jgi:hypothetical protein